MLDPLELVPFSVAAETKRSAIARLNDLARRAPETVNASWTITAGVAALLTPDAGDTPSGTASNDNDRQLAFRHLVAAFADFSSGNDPTSEHDFGVFRFEGKKLFFKIEYYHPDHDTCAPVPSSVQLCRRVVHIMLASEYK